MSGAGTGWSPLGAASSGGCGGDDTVTAAATSSRSRLIAHSDVPTVAAMSRFDRSGSRPAPPTPRPLRIRWASSQCDADPVLRAGVAKFEVGELAAGSAGAGVGGEGGESVAVGIGQAQLGAGMRAFSAHDHLPAIRQRVRSSSPVSSTTAAPSRGRPARSAPPRPARTGRTRAGSARIPAAGPVLATGGRATGRHRRPAVPTTPRRPARPARRPGPAAPPAPAGRWPRPRTGPEACSRPPVARPPLRPGRRSRAGRRARQRAGR